MNVALISIGDELLIGQTINTNAAWLGQELALRGIQTVHGAVIPDEKQAIMNAIDFAMKQADLVIVSGGLGPTKDDITKEVLCTYFNTELVRNEEVLEHVKSFFSRRGRPMLEVNTQQADLPKSAQVMKNELGTASGMWFEQGAKVLLSLPGVPYEMKHIMATSGFKRIESHFSITPVYFKTIQIQGIGESYIAEQIKELESDLRARNFGLAYLPQPGLVRIRFSCTDTIHNRDYVQRAIDEVLGKFSTHAIASDLELSEIVGQLLDRKKAKVATIESCTGGALAAEIVKTPGSSNYFMGSVVTYSNQSKQKLAGVSPVTLNDHGAVSEHVVREMVVGGINQFGVEYGVATSGIAGPDGGSEEKPVGLVWIAVGGPNGVQTRKFQFGNDRERNIRMTVLSALNLLRCELEGINY